MLLRLVHCHCCCISLLGESCKLLGNAVQHTLQQQVVVVVVVVLLLRLLRPVAWCWAKSLLCEVMLMHNLVMLQLLLLMLL
jgi:hypothetical protein